MKDDYQSLLKPEIINSVSGLALISRVLVDNYLSGSNRSRRVGQGMEFSQYRGYEQGDDLRLLDWKMLARSGRYYIKQSEIETNISTKFIIDASNSMLHQEKGLSKIDYVKVHVATLSYLSLQQGDAIGLFSLNNQGLSSLQPKIQKQHFNRILQNLIDIKIGGRWPENTVQLEKLHDRNQREMIFFITDMYEENEELSTFINGLKTSRNEVIVLHIMGKQEREFDYSGNLTFVDLESGAQFKVDSNSAKAQYHSKMNQFITDTKERLLSNAITYSLFTLGNPVEETLQLFLKQRSNLI
ncbi:Protein of unknown function DUF58 [Flavobacteriaceae bacterium MAR_2010_188]|nr:Protein of unknown function DUF58 [Flavobacteriaceae bacterium MAR_2010_188]